MRPALRNLAMISLTLVGACRNSEVTSPPPDVAIAASVSPAAVPATPGSLTALSPKVGTVVLYWKDNSSNETRFEVLRDNVLVKKPGKNVTTATFTSLNPGVSYHWDIRACNASGCSPLHGVIGKTPDGSDGPAIAFSSFRDGNYEIYTMMPSGSAQRRLTTNAATDGGVSHGPVYSPDGSRVAFMSLRTGNPDIFVMNADGSNVTQLTNNSAGDDYPAWSPDGTKLVFASTRDFPHKIYTMDAVDLNLDGEGDNLVSLTPGVGYSNLQPAWSPDGLHIAFMSDRTGLQQIFIMDAATGANQQQLTNVSQNANPSWSHDGTRIAFQSQRNGPSEIFVMNADGSNQLLRATGGLNDGPTWSPDDSKIAFYSNRNGINQIWVMFADGTNQRNVSKTASEELFPHWRGAVAAPF